MALQLLGSSLTDAHDDHLTWDTHPVSQTVETGSNATFTCSATYNSTIEYHWKHNNKTIEVDTKPRFTMKANGTLEITNTKLEDQGTYQCYVTMKGRNKTQLGESDRATLNVKGKLTTNNDLLSRV